MSRTLEEIIAEQAQTWSGIAPPNEAAKVLAASLDAIIRGFEALRGELVFEDEPSSFEAALQAVKEPTP
jgi:hypothetical protein